MNTMIQTMDMDKEGNSFTNTVAIRRMSVAGIIKQLVDHLQIPFPKM